MRVFITKPKEGIFLKIYQKQFSTPTETSLTGFYMSEILVLNGFKIRKTASLKHTQRHLLRVGR